MKKFLALTLAALFFSACSTQAQEQHIPDNQLEGVLYLNEGAKGGPFLQVGDTPYFLDEDQLERALPGYKEMNETLFTLTGATDSHLCAAYEQCLLSGMIHRFETIDLVMPHKSEPLKSAPEPFIHTSFNGFELTFPAEWEGVTENPDRGGFGSQEENPMVPIVYGDHSTFSMGEAWFQITRISIVDKDNPAIPDSAQYLGVNEEYAYYAETFDGNAEGVQEIIGSFKLLD